MEIIRKSKDFTTLELYNLTKSPEIQKMRDEVGASITVTDYVVYSDINSKGEEQQILSVYDEMTKNTMATNSPTFIREFLAIVDMAESANEKLNTIEVIEGKSKAGREFITCKLLSTK